MRAVWAHLAGNPDLVITLADDYAAMGNWQDAVALLDRKYPALAAANEAEPGTVLPQDYALVAYSGATAGRGWAGSGGGFCAGGGAIRTGCFSASRAHVRCAGSGGGEESERCQCA